MSIATALTALADDVDAAKAAITAKGGTAPNGTADMADAIASIPTGGITPSGTLPITENGTYDVTEYAEAVVDVSGGTEITDGIVVKARNASGYATEVEHYGNAVEAYQFGSGRYEAYSFKYLGKVNLHGAVKIRERAFSYCHYNVTGDLTINGTESVEEIDSYAFANSKLANAVFPNVTVLAEYAFRTALSVSSLKLPKLTRIGSKSMYDVGAAGSTIQIGSIGNTVAYADRLSFVATNSKTIIIFTSGAYADTIVENVRNGVPHGTIIIKASEDTTYGGVSYAAGDTMITSEVA